MSPGLICVQTYTYYCGIFCNEHWSLAADQDDFKITKKIATGGFGTVYRAECDDGKTPGGRPVIIKKASYLASLCSSTILLAFWTLLRCSDHYAACHSGITVCILAHRDLV